MKVLIVKLPDNSEWGIPLALIAQNKADQYEYLELTNLPRSEHLFKVVIPGFQENIKLAYDWAEEIKWQDAMNMAEPVSNYEETTDNDWKNGWIKGSKRIDEYENFKSNPKKFIRTIFSESDIPKKKKRRKGNAGKYYNKYYL